ncbi:MAG: hypothetical protein ACI9R3_005796 [Verrucomicrobiales bacterium]|jgi:hypothetical protein
MLPQFGEEFLRRSLELANAGLAAELYYLTIVGLCYFASHRIEILIADDACFEWIGLHCRHRCRLCIRDYCGVAAVAGLIVGWRQRCRLTGGKRRGGGNCRRNCQVFYEHFE